MASAELAGKISIVTGGARGIGSGCALELAKRGAKVIVHKQNFLQVIS